MKYTFPIQVFIPVIIAIYLISCHGPEDPLTKIRILISDYIKDSVYKSRYNLDSIQIFKIDTIRQHDIIARQIRYHDARRRRMEDLANMQLSRQFLSFSKYKFFVQTRDSVNASRIQSEMTQQTLLSSRFSDSAQLYQRVLDSLTAVASTDNSALVYYQVFYKQFCHPENNSRIENTSSVILLPDFTIKAVEPTRDLVRDLFR